MKRTATWRALALLAAALPGCATRPESKGVLRRVRPADAPRTAGEIPVEVRGVFADPSGSAFAVLLRATIEEVPDGKRLLPIFVGPAEGQAIGHELGGVRHPRPMTHDLLRIAIERLGARVERVVVTRLEEGTYFADLALRLEDGRPLVLDARPSDAIAVAVRAGAPIAVSADLLATAGFPEGEEGLPLVPLPETRPTTRPRRPA